MDSLLSEIRYLETDIDNKRVYLQERKVEFLERNGWEIYCGEMVGTTCNKGQDVVLDVDEAMRIEIDNQS